MRPTAMYIHLGALEHNARVIRGALPAHVKMMAVVKADAYGHGQLALSERLARSGVDALAVAIEEEAIALRRGGIKLPLLVLGALDPKATAEVVAFGISQTVYDAESLMYLQRIAKEQGIRAKAHLKIDTGMIRLGVRTLEMLENLLETWKLCPDVQMEGVYTHFCAADEDAEFTRVQNDRFERAVGIVKRAGFSPAAHAAATSAALMPKYQHDMVRPGIGLYGSLMPELADKLRPAQQLVTRPVRIETIVDGETVGYGRTYTAKGERRIMTLPIGYGDGYPRILSGRADVLVRGRRARIAGRICMDMMMADVTDIPGVAPGDEVVLLGSQAGECILPDELAERANTIPYEIMLGFSPRVRRIIVE